MKCACLALRECQLQCAQNPGNHHDHPLVVSALFAANCPNACSCGCWNDTYTFGGGQKHHHSRVVPGPRCSSRPQGDDMCKATFSGPHFWYQGWGSWWWLQPGTHSIFMISSKHQQVKIVGISICDTSQPSLWHRCLLCCTASPDVLLHTLSSQIRYVSAMWLCYAIMHLEATCVGCGWDDYWCLSNLNCQSCTINLPAMAEHNGIPMLSMFIPCIG